MNERADYKNLKNDLEIEQELIQIFNSEDVYDEKTISLYNVLKTIQKVYREYEEEKADYEQYFTLLLKRKYDYPKVEIQDGLHGIKELTLAFTPNYHKSFPFKKITFSERDTGLYVKNDETGCSYNIYRALGNDIVRCYLALLPYSVFFTERKEGVRPLNSNLFVNIDKFGVSLLADNRRFSDAFCFSVYSGFGYYQKDEYGCNNKLSRAYARILGNEKELLKKIFIEIEDCPEWLKEDLYQQRKKELNSIKTKILKIFK